MNPSFNFTFGMPADDGSGRWVEGSVRRNESGFTFTADLRFREGEVLSSQRVSLDVDRPFVASDFVAYVRLVTNGKFATVNRVVGLYETDSLDPERASAIFQALAVWVDPWEHDFLPLLEELAALGNQLDVAWKREKLSLALVNFRSVRMPGK